ncbi:hypothetical protein [Hymenobacter latericus]|uniref:hypothetical protein n=1 Tax=Hymenobacter sp. YIM 151858-1 TaxID=2987688 RepID=UPI002226F3B3|nr:hypothetical protein [Hymenobacter sp. YIM 151858-1]UYZ60153.1 hypothetical protein OIS50_04960 [Hymenobacter sp. YIM 151858-1]
MTAHNTRTPERIAAIDDYIRRHAATMNVKDMARKLRADHRYVSLRRAELGLVPESREGHRQSLPPRHVLSAADRAFLKAHHATLLPEQLAERINAPLYKVKEWLRKNGLAAQEDLAPYQHVIDTCERIDRKRMEEGELPKFRKATPEEAELVRRRRQHRKPAFIPVEVIDLTPHVRPRFF